MEKDTDAFRTISEVAEELDLPQHVLRFWETRFRQIKPMKRGGGRRYYRPDDVELLRGIKGLLYDEGYTIRGVQRLLKEHGNRLAIEFGRTGLLATEGSEPIIETDETGVGVKPPQGVLPSQPSPETGLKPAGIIGRLTSRVSQPLGGQSADVAISKSDMDALKATLQELLECKRLLDQTRQR